MFENDDRAPALREGLGEGPWPSIDFRRIIIVRIESNTETVT